MVTCAPFGGRTPKRYREQVAVLFLVGAYAAGLLMARRPALILTCVALVGLTFVPAVVLALAGLGGLSIWLVVIGAACLPVSLGLCWLGGATRHRRPAAA